MRYLSSKFAPYLFFALLIVLFYGNTLFNGFVHDDIWQVQDNKYVKSISNIPNIFTSCIAEEMLGGCRFKGFYYRPLQSVVYALIYQISSKPWIFHLANLFYLWVLSVLVFKLHKTLLSGQGSGIYLAFLGTILFIIHPINSEVVNWISATPELLTTLFLLVAILLYERFIRTGKVYILVFSALVYFLALLSKETALFLVVLFPLYEYLFGKPKKDAGLSQRYSFIVFYMAIVGVYLIFREEALGRVIYKYEGYYALSYYSQVINALSLLPRYFLKLIFPLPLSFQPQVIPTQSFGATSFLGLGFMLIFAISAFWAWKKKAKVILFGLALLILPLIPVLLFINKLGENLFSERYLFVSTIGFTVLLVEVGKTFGKVLKKARKAFFVMLVCLIGVSWWVVFNRNEDWKDNFSSYQSMIKVDPKHKKAHFQLGELYMNQGDFDNAQKEYKLALTIDPQFTEANRSLSLISRRYRSNLGFSFFLPEGWEVSEKDQVKLIGGKQLNVEISLDNIQNELFDKYLDRQTEKYGQLSNQGLAQIPQFERAFVKVWNNNEIVSLQFFLLQQSKVIKILIFPVPQNTEGSAKMQQFNSILGSIRIQ